jgi:hypothetical protein
LNLCQPSGDIPAEQGNAGENPRREFNEGGFGKMKYRMSWQIITVPLMLSGLLITGSAQQRDGNRPEYIREQRKATFRPGQSDAITPGQLGERIPGVRRRPTDRPPTVRQVTGARVTVRIEAKDENIRRALVEFYDRIRQTQRLDLNVTTRGETVDLAGSAETVNRLPNPRLATGGDVKVKVTVFVTVKKSDGTETVVQVNVEVEVGSLGSTIREIVKGLLGDGK